MDDKTFYSYLERKQNGEDFSSIRAELKNEGYTDVEISKIVQEIDEELMLSPRLKKSSIQPRTLLGLGIGIVSATLWLIGIRSIWILLFFLAGLAMLAVRIKPRNKKRMNSKWERH